MATGAAAGWPGRPRHVLSMVEFDVEAFFEFRRKTFQRRVGTIYVRMADRTHGNIGRDKLREVAARARLVPGKSGRGRIVSSAFVASRARKRGMLLTAVPEI
ncbi:MAG: hypothetical protein M3R69_00055 [Acidobacteriota bacterium]|nr:hypothetical protein [Acidobacteriota bacterium]